MDDDSRWSVSILSVASYGWDANGNRAGSLVDAQDRLVQQGDATWTYDAMGHLKTRSDSRGTWTFTYDALWNLLSATGPENITYVVDARGRRVGRRASGTSQGFLYSGQLNIVAELGPSGVVSRFVYGSRANVPEYMVRDGQRYKLVTDHLGSVRLVVDVLSGAIVSRIDYNVWGEITYSENLSFQPFGFAGGLRDDATGLVRFGARDYDPHVGRWTGKDPLGMKIGGGGNLSAYSGNDPINFWDPTGLITFALGFGGSIFAPDNALSSGGFGFGFFVTTDGAYGLDLGPYTSTASGNGVDIGVSANLTIARSQAYFNGPANVLACGAGKIGLNFGFSDPKYRGKLTSGGIGYGYGATPVSASYQASNTQSIPVVQNLMDEVASQANWFFYGGMR